MISCSCGSPDHPLDDVAGDTEVGADVLVPDFGGADVPGDRLSVPDNVCDAMDAGDDAVPVPDSVTDAAVDVAVDTSDVAPGDASVPADSGDDAPVDVGPADSYDPGGQTDPGVDQGQVITCEPGLIPSNVTPGTCVPGFRQLSSRGNHTCGVTVEGLVYCWGANEFGQLGDGTRTDARVPVRASGVSGVASVAAGYSTTCVLDGAGSVSCWGQGAVGALGTGGDEPSLTPVHPVGMTGGVTAISSGCSHACAIKDGDLYCWGLNNWGEVGVDVNDSAILTPSKVDLGKVAEVSCGCSHTCALTADDKVYCWGANEYGQLGDGTVDNAYGPGITAGQALNTVHVASGGHHSCMLNRTPVDDAVARLDLLCWGNDRFGQILGQGEEVCTVYDFRCVLSRQQVASWEVGIDQAVPAPSLGNSHTCVLGEMGQVRCIGYNAYAQLGDGTTKNRFDFVTVIPSGVKQVSTGENHTCALRDDGMVLCWGRDEFGECGGGWTFPKTPSPIKW